MKRREVGSLIVLGICGLVFLFYQTPIMRAARVATWEWWVGKVAAMWHVGQISINQDTLSQLQSLRADNTRLQYQLRDYTHLRAALATPTIDSYQQLQAAVLGRPIDTMQTEFALSKGTLDGVKPGSPVVINGSILIGFITTATEHTSVLRLLFYPETSLTTEVVTDDNSQPPARGLIAGQHYTALLLTTVPRDVHIKTSQPIVTVATDTVPPGLTIGAVGKVTNKENEPYQQADVMIPYDIDSLVAVTILVHP